MNIIDPLGKKSSANGSAAIGASGLGGATNLDGGVGDSWKSPFLLRREQRGHLGSGSSSRQSGGQSNAGTIHNGPDFDAVGRTGSGGQSDAETNSKY